MSENGARAYPDIPEPLPISVDPSIDKQARAFLQMATLGVIDRSIVHERLSAILSDAGIAVAAEHAAALGIAQEMYAFEQRTTAEGVATYDRVRYPSDIWTWVFSVDHAGRINGFSLRRTPRYKIYNAWLRDVAYRCAPGTALRGLIVVRICRQLATNRAR